MIAAPTVPSRERVKILDFTGAFWEDVASCLIPAPREMDKMAAIVEPFQYKVSVHRFLSSYSFLRSYYRCIFPSPGL